MRFELKDYEKLFLSFFVEREFMIFNFLFI